MIVSAFFSYLDKRRGPPAITIAAPIAPLLRPVPPQLLQVSPDVHAHLQS